MQCPSCGHHLPRGMMICPKCGMSLPYNVFEPESEQATHSNIAHVSEEAMLVASNALVATGEPPSSQHVQAEETHTETYMLFGDTLGVADAQDALIDTSYGLSIPSLSSQAAEQAEVFVPVIVPTDTVTDKALFASHLTPSDRQFAHDIVLTESSLSAPARLLVPPLLPASLVKRQHAHLSRPMLVLLTAVAVLLVLSGSSLIYYTAVARPAQLHAQATAMAQALRTREAHATATAIAIANATAVAIANATATAQAQAQATTTALQDFYTQSTKGTPALLSSLAYQDGNSWDIYNTVDGGGCSFGGGSLSASVLTKGYYVPCMEHAGSYTNFAFQAQVVLLKGDAGGLIFRADNTNSQYYIFYMRSDGFFGAYVTQGNTSGHTLIYSASTAIKSGFGQANALTVVARASDFYFYINGQYVGSTSDKTLSSGLVGVFAADESNNTSVSFSNAKLWIL